MQQGRSIEDFLAYLRRVLCEAQSVDASSLGQPSHLLAFQDIHVQCCTHKEEEGTMQAAKQSLPAFLKEKETHAGLGSPLLIEKKRTGKLRRQQNTPCIN
jgi:hypothetical protein